MRNNNVQTGRAHMKHAMPETISLFANHFNRESGSNTYRIPVFFAMAV